MPSAPLGTMLGLEAILDAILDQVVDAYEPVVAGLSSDIDERDERERPMQPRSTAVSATRLLSR